MHVEIGREAVAPGGTAVATKHRGHPWRRFAPAAVVLAAVAVVAAACGGGSALPGVASLGSTTTTVAASAASSSALFPNVQQVYEDGVAYAQCMRSHGIASYPNPTLTKNGVNLGNSGSSSSTPGFSTANSACEHYLPNGRGPPSSAQITAVTQRLLTYAKCMRSHGVTNFPDPIVNTGNGSGFAIGFRGAGIDPSSPQYKTAQRACGSLLPGK